MTGFLKYLILPLGIAVLFGGCMANIAGSIGVDIKGYEAFDEKFAHGDYTEAAEFANSKKDTDKEVDSSNLLSTLQAANAYLFAKEYKKSIELFDESEEIIKLANKKVLLESSSDYIASLMVNEAALDYRASISEAVMVNTYKALAYMALGDNEAARVEFNRAIDRQRRAKETYAELIAKQKEALALKKREIGSAGVDKTLSSSHVKGIIERNYSSLGEFEAYPDFINPFTTYLGALFFSTQGDHEKASSLFKESYGMMPKNETVRSDFELSEKALLGKKSKERYLWVICESGLAPIKEELRISIPLYILPHRLLYTGIALPKLKVRNTLKGALEIYSKGAPLARTSPVGDMQRVIFSEFNYAYTDIVTKAVFSAILKTYAQNTAAKGNAYLGLASAALQSLTNHADTRVWSTLPKEFQVAKVKITNENAFVLKTRDHSLRVEVPKNAKYALAYVRIPSDMSKPSVSVINLKENR